MSVRFAVDKNGMANGVVGGRKVDLVGGWWPFGAIRPTTETRNVLRNGNAEYEKNTFYVFLLLHSALMVFS